MARVLLINLAYHSDAPMLPLPRPISRCQRRASEAESCKQNARKRHCRALDFDFDDSSTIYDPCPTHVFEDDEVKDGLPSTASPTFKADLSAQAQPVIVELKRASKEKSEKCNKTILISDDPLPAHDLKPYNATELSVASHLNAHVPYSTMTFGALAGAGLFTWEQSVETVPMNPIIPMTLFWATVLCTLGLPLSMLAMDEIKDLQVSADSCSADHEAEHKRERTKQSANHARASSRDEKQKKTRRWSGGALRDSEDLVNSEVKCTCIQCIPKSRRFITYFFLYLPSVFTVVALILCIITLIALMFTTEKRSTAIISTAFCVPAIATFVMGMGWFMPRRLGWKSWYW